MHPIETSNALTLCRAHTVELSWATFSLNYGSRNSYRQSAFPVLQRFLRMIAAYGELFSITLPLPPSGRLHSTHTKSVNTGSVPRSSMRCQ